MPPLEIRPAIGRDLPELVRIYNHYVLETHITFDIRPFRPEERRPWLESFAERGPHRLLVAVRDSVLLGYASSSRHRAKPAYDRSVETTVYLGPEHVGKGVGRQLYATLLDQLAAEPDLHRAFGGIALPNPASIALHERLGFGHIGTFGEIGYKFDRYWDVSWYERPL